MVSESALLIISPRKSLFAKAKLAAFDSRDQNIFHCKIYLSDWERTNMPLSGCLRLTGNMFLTICLKYIPL